MIVGIFLVILIIFINILSLRRRNRGKLPKTYRKITLTPPSTFPEDLTRDRYMLKKIPEHIDVIILGSGVSGLTTGAILSKIGKKVLVIEQHYVAGGNLHVFSDKGYEFETGLHYVNAAPEKELGLSLLNLVTKNKVEWCSLGRENPEMMIYERVFIGDESFDFRSGKNELKNDLKARFPEETQAIDDYFNEVNKSNRVSGISFILKIISNSFLYYLLNAILSRLWVRYMKATVHEVISKFTKDRKLEAVLCTQFGDYGMIPTEAPFFIHALVVNHYFPGAHFPLGSPQEIARKLIETIYSYGGKVLVSKKVSKILVDESKNCVLGIQMENGNVIGCSNVISTVVI